MKNEIKIVITENEGQKGIIEINYEGSKKTIKIKNMVIGEIKSSSDSPSYGRIIAVKGIAIENTEQSIS